jgi:RimJ/RimL family protein N-acetyltransferase
VITLVRADLRLIEAAVAGDDALAAVLGAAVAPGWVTFAGALTATRDQLAADPSASEWGTRLFLAGDRPAAGDGTGRRDGLELVGWGGFKGPPAQGTVEVGYEIAAGRRDRGLATAATRAMVAEAFADDRVTRVIAHTLAETNASNHILEKVGFRRAGEVVDGGQRLWRFALARAAWRPDAAAGPGAEAGPGLAAPS